MPGREQVKSCPYCGTAISNLRRVQCGAPECRRAHKTAYMREWQREYEAQHGHWYNRGLRKRFSRECVQCEKKWQAHSPTVRFCSFACQAAHQHGERRKRKLSRAERRRASAARRLQRSADGSSGRTPWVAGTCSECAAPFATQLPLARTCSTACRRRRDRKRARAKSNGIRDAVRYYVYERDGWTCQLCFEPVDPDLHYLDNWAASLDHIVCRAWTDRPDHSPDNLRLAHRWCNSVRGDESYYTGDVLTAA